MIADAQSREGGRVSDPPLPRAAWERRLSLATQGFIGLFIVLAISDKWREGADVAAALAAACALILARLRPRPRESARLGWLFAGALLAFLACNLLAWIAAPAMDQRGHFNYRDLHATGVLVAFAAAWGLRERLAVRRMLVFLLLAAGWWYAEDLACMTWPGRAPFRDGRFEGFRDYPNELAGELAVLLPLFLGWLLADKRARSMALSAAGAALVGALLLMTKVRGALLTAALAAVPATLFFQERLGSLRRRLAAAAVWLLLLAPAAGLVWYHFAGERRRSPETAETRLQIYDICRQVAVRAPWYRTLAGHGPSSRVFRAAALHYRTDSPVIRNQQIQHAHNVMLQVGLESGMLGLAALLGVWLVAFRSAWTAWRAGSALAGMLLAGLIAVAAAGQVDYTLWKVVGHLSWLIAGLAFASGAGASPAAQRDQQP